jgi:hypothetical protein
MSRTTAISKLKHSIFSNHNLFSSLLKSQSPLASSSHPHFNTLSVLHFSSSPTLTMRFSAELVALVAISSFGLVAAAPVPEAEADPAPLFIGGQYYGGGFE